MGYMTECGWSSPPQDGGRATSPLFLIETTNLSSSRLSHRFFSSQVQVAAKPPVVSPGRANLRSKYDSGKNESKKNRALVSFSKGEEGRRHKERIPFSHGTGRTENLEDAFILPLLWQLFQRATFTKQQWLL